MKSASFYSFPPPLKPKGTIGIVSPGRWADPMWIDMPKEYLENRGYQVVVHSQNYIKEGQLAGSDEARAEAIIDMFADSTIDAILCARGGTGSLRILEKLDFDLIAKQPKPFVGFSDITVLLHAISKRCGFVTYHGPLGWNFAQPENDPRVGIDLLNVIGNRRKQFRMLYSEAECLRPGKTEGILIGGNITLLQHLIGTPFDWFSQDIVLFLEDTDIPLYALDRALTHMKLAGKFQNLKAVLIGEMINIPDSETCFAQEGERPFGKNLKDIILEHIPENIPLALNFPCGHGKYITTLPVGARAQISISQRGVELIYTVPETE